MPQKLYADRLWKRGAHSLYNEGMAQKFDPKVYASLLRVRQAYAFDAGCFLMRFYAYMMNIGTVTMVTLAGYSFFIAGLTSSVIALSTFFISPRVSKFDRSTS